MIFLPSHLLPLNGNEGNILHLVSDNEKHGSLRISISNINCMWKIGETVYMPAE